MKSIDSRYAPFVKEIEAASGRYRSADVFVDACHCMALSIWSAFCFGKTKMKVEADYKATHDKYNDKEWPHIVNAFVHLISALEDKREEFLGHCMNLFDATNKWNGQVLTPICVSRMMGEMTAPEPRDEVITLHDPCCGAGVLMIEGAETFLEKGWQQRNLCIIAGDIDYRACDMTYIQLSLLGYAGAVQQIDAITLESFGEARFTPGWYMHGFPMRGIKAPSPVLYVEKGQAEAQTPPTPEPPTQPPTPAKEAEPVGNFVQGELF